MKPEFKNSKIKASEHQSCLGILEENSGFKVEQNNMEIGMKSHKSPTDKLSAVAVETLQRLTPELWEGLTLTSSS